MNNSNGLLDLYSRKLSLTTNQAIADRLGVQRPTVSMWRSGKSHPDAVSVEKMCAAVGEPLRQWLPLIEAERAHSPAAKRVWLRLAQAAAAFALIYLFSRLDVHHDVFASVAFVSRNPGAMYIMSTLSGGAALGMILAALAYHTGSRNEVFLEV